MYTYEIYRKLTWNYVKTDKMVPSVRSQNRNRNTTNQILRKKLRSSKLLQVPVKEIGLDKIISKSQFPPPYECTFDNSQAERCKKNLELKLEREKKEERIKQFICICCVFFGLFFVFYHVQLNWTYTYRISTYGVFLNLTFDDRIEIRID